MASALLLFGACASAPKRTEAVSPRVRDAAPEKLAAQRAAAPHSLTLEQDEERWGFEAARERRRRQEEEKARRQPPAGGKAVDVTAR
jgi:hypothetical protein